MAVTYFGNNTNGTAETSHGGVTRWNDPGQITYTCPGAGAQDLKELAFRPSDTGGNGRVAVYTTGGAFIAQGATQLLGVASAWVPHTTFVDQGGSPSTPQLTGGTDYILAFSGDGSITMWRDAVTSGDIETVVQDYTGGFPANLPGSSSSGVELCVRAGVEPAAGGVVLTDRYFRMVMGAN